MAGVDPAAQALGLMPGMALAHAQALVPGLNIAEADPAAEAETLLRMAEWCRGVTPLVAVDGVDGLWLDVTGCAHLFGGEAGLLEHVVGRLRGEGLAVRAGLADTPGAAHAVARQKPPLPLAGEGWVEGGANGGMAGECFLIPPGQHMAVLSALPVRALRLPGDTVATLRRLGFERIGDLARVPRASLARRLGTQLGLRLDQAEGRVLEPIVPLPAPELMQHRVTFVEPLLTPEGLALAIQHLMEPLCARMEQTGQGARRLDLLFERVDGATEAIRIGTARPSRAAAHLTRLLTERLEEVDPGLGVEAMRLVAPLVEPLRWTQLDENASDVSELVDRLSNRLGPECVYRQEPVESDVPERSVRRVPALSPRTGRHWARTGPTRLFARPRPVQALALLPDQPPVAFTWAGRRHRVVRADGPERVHGEWWRRDAETDAVRDYFQVEDEDGRRFWLYRQGDGVDPRTGGLHWYVHGLF